MNSPPTYLFSGGGTGGHLFPGLAVAEELRERAPEARIVFVGSGRAIEREIVAAHRYEHCVLSVEPSSTLRRNPLRFLWNNWRALCAAGRLLDRERPSAVIGLGGFASIPVVWAASRRGIPTILLEQNIVAGRATRLLSRRASLICVSFAETVDDLPRRARICVTGNPVRREIAALHSRTGFQPVRHNSDGLKTHSTGGEIPTLLILGGSQGAVAVNEAVFAALEQLAPQLADWKIVHQTGREQADRAAALYRRLGLRCEVRPYFDNLPDLYARATLAVSRAGATTLAELACAACPAILIPYPNSIRDHQRKNAQAFANAGGAVIVEQSPNSTGERLVDALRPLLLSVEQREEMVQSMHALSQPQAAGTVAGRVLQLAGRSGNKQAA